jgi:hypothetical protein
MAIYTVITRKAALKRIRKAPERVQQRFALLLSEMAEAGPYRANWPNYSPLGDNQYHCHLGFSWVACWTYSKEIVTIEVYYAGSRESAPY